MTGTTTATGDGFGSPLDVLWSADQVARLLALAEQANRCDGWLTADDLGRLSLDMPLEDYGEKWRTAIARLGEQFTNFHVFLASPDRSRELVSGLGVCVLMCVCVISDGGVGGLGVLGVLVGVVCVVGGCFVARVAVSGRAGSEFGSGRGRRGGGRRLWGAGAAGVQQLWRGGPPVEQPQGPFA